LRRPTQARAKFERAWRKRSPDTVGKTCRVANQSAPIRAILRAGQAVNASANACSAKIFSRGRPPHVDFSAQRKTRHIDACECMRAARCRNRNGQETRILSAFPGYADFAEAVRTRRKIFAAPAARRLSRARWQAPRRRSYAQTQVESLLFFSCCSNPVAVPVDSRRHCTMSPSTQARRAAMAKKRKKAAKPAKKRRKKK